MPRFEPETSPVAAAVLTIEPWRLDMVPSVVTKFIFKWFSYLNDPICSYKIKEYREHLFLKQFKYFDGHGFKWKLRKCVFFFSKIFWFEGFFLFFFSWLLFSLIYGCLFHIPALFCCWLFHLDEVWMVCVKMEGVFCACVCVCYWWSTFFCTHSSRKEWKEKRPICMVRNQSRQSVETIARL